MTWKNASDTLNNKTTQNCIFIMMSRHVDIDICITRQPQDVVTEIKKLNSKLGMVITKQ